MYELGVNAYSAGAELNAAINGKTASRYDDHGTQIDMIVRLDPADKQKFTDLEQLYVMNSSGQRIPFASFSRYEQALSPVQIRRESQTRTIRISLEPKKGYSLGVIQKKVDSIIKENVIQDENLIISYDGSYKDMVEAIQKFSVVIIMAACLVFAVMASQFESFKDPYIIIFTIPLSFIGVVLIYLLTGTMMNVVSVVGMLVLVGTIVNNGIVLVDYTNLLRKRGYSLEEGCVEAARNRLRPILMSTLTTITSLIPMAFFPGEGGQMTQPIGLTVLGGMSFGSLMTLFVMPVIYYIFNAKRERKIVEERAKEKQDTSFFVGSEIEEKETYRISSPVAQKEDAMEETAGLTVEQEAEQAIKSAETTIENERIEQAIEATTLKETAEKPKIVRVLADKANTSKTKSRRALAARLKELQQALTDVSEMIMGDNQDGEK